MLVHKDFSVYALIFEHTTGWNGIVVQNVLFPLYVANFKINRSGNIWDFRIENLVTDKYTFYIKRGMLEANWTCLHSNQRKQHMVSVYSNQIKTRSTLTGKAVWLNSNEQTSVLICSFTFIKQTLERPEHAPIVTPDHQNIWSAALVSIRQVMTDRCDGQSMVSRLTAAIIVAIYHLQMIPIASYLLYYHTAKRNDDIPRLVAWWYKSLCRERHNPEIFAANNFRSDPLFSRITIFTNVRSIALCFTLLVFFLSYRFLLRWNYQNHVADLCYFVL